jgi:hypothetical protein
LAKRVPFDSFSLREKVAEGRMRVNRRMVFCTVHYLIAGLFVIKIFLNFPSQFS